MLNYSSIDINTLAKDFTGILFTKWSDGMLIMYVYEDGNISDYIDIDPESDSIEQLLFAYFANTDCSEEVNIPDFFVDDDIMERFLENLIEFPFVENEDLFDSDTDEVDFMSPQERAALEEEREEAAEDAFTRFCDQ